MIGKATVRTVSRIGKGISTGRSSHAEIIQKGRRLLPRPKTSALNLVEIRRIANNPARDEGFTRTYYSYPAKFQAQLPHALITNLTSEGDLVLDPYCGGGTTGLESLILGRRSVNYDINPFAILIGIVKTTKLNSDHLTKLVDQVFNLSHEPRTTVLDDGDKECLGSQVALEIDTVIENIQNLETTRAYKDFFRLAAIHSIKIIGRRDFVERDDDNGNGLELFEGGALPRYAFVATMRKKVRKMIEQMSTLPDAKYFPKFYCHSNHDMHHVETQSVALIITSPPYKDIDVEYALLQIQRPNLQRSKRSAVIDRILGVSAPDRSELCGFRGEAYWTNLEPTLVECARVLRTGALAFFWTGFKEEADKRRFEELCEEHSLPMQAVIPVTLSHDRVASSRSTHHGKETGMLSHDYLFAAQRST
jgi:DNA modification methylase